MMERVEYNTEIGINVTYSDYLSSGDSIRVKFVGNYMQKVYHWSPGCITEDRLEPAADYMMLWRYILSGGGKRDIMRTNYWPPPHKMEVKYHSKE